MSLHSLRVAALPALAAVAILAGSGVATASRPLSAPSTAQINARLRHTIEIGTKGEYFRNLGKALTIKDGRGTGTLTANCFLSPA